MRRTRTAGRLVIVAVAVALVAAACGGTGGGDRVRPFSELQASPVTFGFDDRGLAQMTVDTDLPAVCSIAWGPTEELGNLNTDLDMGGTGHTEHHVLLPGAESGRTYSYRLQGTTPDGRLFQSELMTFTLPANDAAPANPGPGPNLAVGASVVAVSSMFSPAWSGENAVDGDLTTEWATAGNGDDAFIVIDLGAPRRVVGVEFLTRSMTDGSATTTEYTVTVDGGTPQSPFPAATPGRPAVAALDVTGQVFRFDVAASTGGNTGAIEVRIFGAPEG